MAKGKRRPLDRANWHGNVGKRPPEPWWNVEFSRTFCDQAIPRGSLTSLTAYSGQAAMFLSGIWVPRIYKVNLFRHDNKKNMEAKRSIRFAQVKHKRETAETRTLVCDTEVEIPIPLSLPGCIYLYSRSSGQLRTQSTGFPEDVLWIFLPRPLTQIQGAGSHRVQRAPKAQSSAQIMAPKGGTCGKEPSR